MLAVGDSSSPGIGFFWLVYVTRRFKQSYAPGWDRTGSNRTTMFHFKQKFAQLKFSFGLLLNF